MGVQRGVWGAGPPQSTLKLKVKNTTKVSEQRGESLPGVSSTDESAEGELVVSDDESVVYRET